MGGRNMAPGDFWQLTLREIAAMLPTSAGLSRAALNALIERHPDQGISHEQ